MILRLFSLKIWKNGFSSHAQKCFFKHIRSSVTDYLPHSHTHKVTFYWSPLIDRTAPNPKMYRKNLKPTVEIKFCKCKCCRRSAVLVLCKVFIVVVAFLVGYETIYFIYNQSGRNLEQNLLLLSLRTEFEGVETQGCVGLRASPVREDE